MREALGRNFDVVVVVWVIALALAWMLLALTRADLSNAPWYASADAALRVFFA